MDFGPLVPANNPIVREMQQGQLDPAKPAGAQFYSDPPSHDSALGEYVRVLLKRKWIVVACLATIFSVVAIASLRMTPIYEANGTVEINKPDSSLNFQNSATFSLDYYDPTELETEIKILQSDLLAQQVIRDSTGVPDWGATPRPPLGSTSSLIPCRIPRARRPCSADSKGICGLHSALIPASSRFTTAAQTAKWPRPL